MHADKPWFITKYDEIVAASGDEGCTPEKSRDALARAYIDALQTGEVEPYEEDLVSRVRALVGSIVTPERKRRSASLIRSADYLIDALNDETILGVDDPAFSLAYPLGDGRDKRLGLWTVPDWIAASAERRQNSDAARRALVEFERRSNRIVQLLQNGGVRFTQELFEA